MAEAPDDFAYREAIAAAVMKAIFETSITEIDGEKTAYVMTADVCEALVDVLAGLMEGSPICATPKGMRETSEAVGKKVLARMKGLRAAVEATGRRTFANELTIDPS